MSGQADTGGTPGRNNIAGDLHFGDLFGIGRLGKFPLALTVSGKVESQHHEARLGEIMTQLT